MTFFAVAVLLFFASASPAYAAPHDSSVRTCGSDLSSGEIGAAGARFSSMLANHVTATMDGANTGTASIPIYWHVIHGGDEMGNISDKQISDSVDVSNKVFSPAGISFELTKTDRTNNAEWFRGLGPRTAIQKAVKEKPKKGDAAALNIYTFLEGPGKGLPGYATFPNEYEDADDGVVVLYSSVPGGTKAKFDLGMTAVHEVEHWTGLYHTFQGGCRGRWDMVADTPPLASASRGCPKNRDSCPGNGLDMVQNYMDYSDDSCLTKFHRRTNHAFESTTLFVPWDVALKLNVGLWSSFDLSAA